MKIVITASALADALAFVKAVIEARIMMPILGDCRIEADGVKLMIAATNLDHFLIAEIAAPDCEPGVAVAPCVRLAKLLDELPREAAVTLTLDDDRLVVKSGRGRWSLPTLPPEDFPVLESPDASATHFVLAQAEARRLVERTAFAICTEETRYYLNGLSVACRGNKLVVAATDGRRLAEASSEVDPGAMPAVIVPQRAIELLNNVADAGDVAVRVTDQRVEFASAGWRCISKLIDGTFPDYARLVPPPSDHSITVERAALLGAVSRLAAISNAKDVPSAKGTPCIGLTWDSTVLTLCLTREPELGGEEIEPIAASGAERVAISARYLVEQLEALSGQTVIIDHGSPAAPIRITRPDEPTTTTVLMPMMWLAPAVEKPSEQPRRRAKGGR